MPNQSDDEIAEDNINAKHNILFVCTSSSGQRSWCSGQTGLWLEELATPYYIFKEVGYTVSIASIAGGRPPIDQACFTSDNYNSDCERFMNDDIALDTFNNTISLKDLVSQGSLSDYGCIFLCGGHGAIDDYPNNTDMKAVVENVYNDTKGCIAAICHGPLGLLNCYTTAGNRIVKDKFVAAFSNEEEEALGLTASRVSLPFFTETELDAAGAICVPSPPWRPTAVVDGRLVSGQNPQSSLQVAQRVLDVMRSLGSRFSPPGNVNKPWGQ